MQIYIRGGEEFSALGKRLRAAGEQGKGLRRELLKEIRTEGKPTVAAVKASVRAVPSRHDGTLRGGIARGTSLRVRMAGKSPGVRIRVASSRLPAGKQRLPKYLDGSLPGYGRWRHPTFGRDPWVTQSGTPWFFGPIRQHLPAFRAGVRRALTTTANRITRS